MPKSWRSPFIPLALMCLSLVACPSQESPPPAQPVAGQGHEQPPPTAKPQPPPKTPQPEPAATAPPQAAATQAPVAQPPAADPAQPAVSAENQALARELNTEGYRLYNEGKYTQAIPKFEAASEADPTYALPPYNLACTLCLVRGGGGTCENDAYKDRILSQLERSISLDPARLERARSDSDLACVHDTLGYQRLMGYRVENPSDIPHILTHVSWFGPAPGAFGNMSGLDFQADGKVKLWVLEVTDEVKTLHYGGSWTVKGNRISVTLDTPTPNGDTAFSGVISASGIQTSGTLGPFTDLPSECSA